MDANSLETIRARAEESRRQNERVRQLLPSGPAPTLRADFARCAIDLACEHHSAIARLVMAGEYGSAAAMLRPLLEASGSASWLLYCASCDFIRALPTDAATAEGRGRDLPQIDEMARDLLPIFPDIKTLSDGLKNRGPATWLHKYTHGGAAQLVRRGPGWNEGEVMMLLLRADLFAVLASAAETVIAENAELQTYTFGRRDDLGNEIHRLFGVGPVPQQPDHWPPILEDGCGAPFSA
jgi:hypothetical protein